MIREEDLCNEAIGMRLRARMPESRRHVTKSGKPLTPEAERDLARRCVETQLARMCEKLNKPKIRGDGPEVRSRTGLLDRIWVEYWRLREEP